MIYLWMKAIGDTFNHFILRFYPMIVITVCSEIRFAEILCYTEEYTQTEISF